MMVKLAGLRTEEMGKLFEDELLELHRRSHQLASRILKFAPTPSDVHIPAAMGGEGERLTEAELLRIHRGLADQLGEKHVPHDLLDFLTARTPIVKRDELRGLAGIYLIKPHGLWLATGYKTMVMKSVRLTGLDRPHIIVSEGQAWGAVKLAEPKLISADDFEKLEPQHRISDDERRRWWPEAGVLFAYGVLSAERMERPTKVKVPKESKNVLIQALEKATPFSRAVLAIVIRKDRVLLIHRANPPTVWSPPGGFLSGRDAEAAAREELAEETGLHAGKLLGRLPSLKSGSVLIDLLVFHPGGPGDVVLSQEADNWGWFERDRLPEDVSPSQVVLRSAFALAEKSDPPEFHLHNVETILASLPDEVALIPDWLSLSGGAVYAEPGREPRDTDLIVRNFEILPAGSRLKLARLFEKITGKSVHWCPEPEGPTWAYSPMYDLIARRKEGPARILRAGEEEAEGILYKALITSAASIELGKPIKHYSAGGEYYPGEEDQLWDKFARRAIEKGVSILVQEKYDGFRFHIHRGKERLDVFSDKGLERSVVFPGLAAALPEGEYIFDAEFVELDPGGEARPRWEMAWMGSAKEPPDPYPAVLIAIHDALWIKENIALEPYSERLKALKQLIPKPIAEGHYRIEVAPTREARSEKELRGAIAWAMEREGSEGSMLKYADFKYEPKTLGDVAKYKEAIEIDALVIGYRKVPKAKPAGEKWTREEALKNLPQLLEASSTYIFRVAIRDGKELVPLESDGTLAPRDLTSDWDEERQRYVGTDDPKLWTMWHGFENREQGDYKYANTYAMRVEPGELKPGVLVTFAPAQFRPFKKPDGGTGYATMFPRAKNLKPKASPVAELSSVLRAFGIQKGQTHEEEVEKGVRQLFGSPGGKSRLAGLIVGLIPEHRTYVEPFAGGAAVLFAKSPETSEREVLADKDPDIAFVYRTAKGLSDADVKKLQEMKWDIRRFEAVKNSEPKDDLGKFYRWLYLRKLSYGKLGSTPDTGEKERHSEYEANPNFEGIRERLQGVTIRHADWHKALNEFDSKDTFFFLDPPYPETRRGASRDELLWSWDDLAELARRLKSVKGKWLLTLKDDPRARAFFKGYEMRIVTVGTTFDSGEDESVSRQKRRELFVANYRLPRQLRRPISKQAKALDPHFYPSEEESHNFVLQAHWRGRSMHLDFRLQLDDVLEGWTVSAMQPGIIEEPVLTLGQARKLFGNPKVWKLNLSTGSILPRRVLTTVQGEPREVVRPGNLRAFPKKAEIPADWLNVEGATDKPDPGEPIPVGATRQYPGVFVIVDEGTVEFGCFPPGSLIWSTEGLKRVEEIEPGQFLFGVENPTEVLSKFSRDFTGSLLKIRVRGMPDLTVTPNHPVLGWKRELQRQGSRFVKIHEMSPDPSWLSAEKLEKGDFVAIPRLQWEIPKMTLPFKGRLLSLDHDLAWLLGLFVADGHSSGATTYQVTWSVGFKEADVKDRLVTILKDRFGLKAHLRERPGCWAITVNCKDLAFFFREECYDPEGKKRIPSGCFGLDEEGTRSLLKGLFDGDGSKWSSRELGFGNTSQQVAYGFSLLMARLGYLPSNGFKSTSSAYLTQLHWLRKHFDLLGPERVIAAGQNRNWLLDSKFIWAPVLSVEKIEYSGPVYNLETTENTILTPVVTHNSRKGWYFEYFLDGEKFQGRYVFRVLERGRPVEKAGPVLPPSEPEEGAPEDGLFWVFMKPDDETPYVLSPGAVEKGWLPPKGVSALPKKIRDRIPEEYRYWEMAGDKALEARRALAEDFEELGGTEVRKGMLQIFGSPGGKRRIAGKLVDLIPEHGRYVEPYCGAAALFFRKEPSPEEVLGDVDGRILSVFRFFKNASENELKAFSERDWEMTRERFSKLWKSPASEDPSEEAYRWLYLFRGAWRGAGRIWEENPERKEAASSDISMRKCMAWHERLKDVSLRKQDGLKTLEESDSPNTFFYLDPPYLERKPGLWEGEADDFSKDAWLALVKHLAGIKGKFLLSMNSATYKELSPWPRGWDVKRVKVPRAISGRMGVDSPSAEMEVLVANYDLGNVSKSAGDFVLQRHWFRGPIVIRWGPSTEHYDLRVDEGGGKWLHMVIESDPRKGSSLAYEKPMKNASVTDVEGREHKVLDITSPIQLKPGTPENPTKETPGFLETVERGKAEFLERSASAIKVRLAGKKSYTLFFRREGPEQGIWSVSLSGGPQVSKNGGDEEFEWEFPIFKADDEARLIYGIVLKPNVADSQQDVISPEEIEAAAHSFLVNSRVIDEFHRRELPSALARPVESFIAPQELKWGEHTVPKGSWVMVTHIPDDEVWEKVKSGEISAYSIRGFGKRVEKSELFQDNEV
jgi:site-specific DNA-adenine methylase/ADP-ribose pyrophosphatase YjhB (NUDIX family)